MSLAVVLVNWRNQQATLKQLDAIKSWGEARQIYVVVNDTVPSICEQFAAELETDQLICNSSNLGYGGGNNAGIERAIANRCEFVLLLNSDVDISQSTIKQLLVQMKTNSDIGIISPAIREGEGSNNDKIFVGARDIAEHEFTRVACSMEDIEQSPSSALKNVDFVSGMVFLARSSVFETVGLLDERFFFSGEIAEMCKRARFAGLRIAVDRSALACHDTAVTPLGQRRTLYSYYSLRNRFVYVRKHYRAQKAKYFAKWTFTGLRWIVGALRVGDFAQVRALYLALGHGLFDITGNQNDRFE